MKFFEMIFSKNEKSKVTKIFDSKFVKDNKYKYKILYKNKIYPLKSEFLSTDNKIKQFKIKLVYFTASVNIINFLKRCKSYYSIYTNKKYKKNYNKFMEFLKFPCNYKITQKIKSRNPRFIYIFGKNFVNNNKNKCIIVHNDKIYSLMEYILFKDIIIKEDNKFVYYYRELVKIYNKSYMFCSCNSLEEFSYLEYSETKIENEKIKYDIDYDYEESDESNSFYSKNSNNIETLENRNLSSDKNSIFEIYHPLNEIDNKIQKMKMKMNGLLNIKHMFEGCLNLKLLINIPKLNVMDMSYTFCLCSSLASIPGISEWDTSNAINMAHMFEDCHSLKELPDISKWNTEKVKEMSYMFYKCDSLISLPDISNWKIKNVTNLSYMFSRCTSLLALPDISKWNTENVTNISYIFSTCSSLLEMPHISQWNTSNVIEMNNIFEKCSSLMLLPDISEWNTNKVINMSNIFVGCKLLNYLPNISKWNTDNVIDINGMLAGCTSLIKLPDISKWSLKKVIDISNLFTNCISLISLPDISKWNVNNVIKMNGLFG